MYKTVAIIFLEGNLTSQYIMSSSTIPTQGVGLEQNNSVPASKEKIQDRKDVLKYLDICSREEPIIEGHGCKDIERDGIFASYRRRYFVLYDGLLLYYCHKSEFEKDKKNGLVSILVASA